MGKFFEYLQLYVIDILLYAWILYSAIRENKLDYDIQSQIAHLPRPSDLPANATFHDGNPLPYEKDWLHAFAILQSIFISFAGLTFVCIGCFKCCLAQANDLDPKIKEAATNGLNLLLRYWTFTLTFLSYNKLIVYSSVLNKLRYWGLWSGSQDVVSLTNLGDILAHFVPIFIYAPVTGALGNQLKTVCLSISGNISRGLFTFVYLSSATTVKQKFTYFLPVLFVVAFLVSMGGCPLIIFHYTQRISTEMGILGTNTQQNLAIACVCMTMGPIMNIILPLTAAAVPTDETLKRAEISRFTIWRAYMNYYLCMGITFGVFCFVAGIKTGQYVYPHDFNTNWSYPKGVWIYYIAVNFAMLIILTASLFMTCCYCCKGHTGMNMLEVTNRLTEAWVAGLAANQQAQEGEVQRKEDVSLEVYNDDTEGSPQIEKYNEQ